VLRAIDKVMAAEPVAAAMRTSPLRLRDLAVVVVVDRRIVALHIARQRLLEGVLKHDNARTIIGHLFSNAAYVSFIERLASFSHLIQFDKRGTGLSDRVTGIPTLDERSDDLRAVLDAVGSKRTALFGVSEGGPMSVVFSATHPQRTSALILYGSIAKGSWAPDYPWGGKDEAGFEEWLAGWRREWGKPYSLEVWAPSVADDPQFRQWWAKYLRLGASLSAVTTLFRMNREIDVRPILPVIRVPTLVLHRAGDRALNAGQAVTWLSIFQVQNSPSFQARIICGGLATRMPLATKLRSSSLESGVQSRPTAP
jgi:pimeloyl-ACP methyl ester carboxylesterase